MCTDRSAAIGHPARQGGITLVELIVFIVIVGVGIAGILAVMNVTVRSSADPVAHKQMVALAEAILEEVMAKDYTPNATYPEPAANTCPDRSLADDVDDYANCNGTASIPGTEPLGASALLGFLADYRAQVTVEAPAALEGVTMKRITVTVTGPGGRAFALTAYKADY
ncbi:MAG: prepilin-type N-terminal cleavage/methylation domain-containing protein [Sterolibacteriaceae bacterium MAG5]|nr:prepilin-type N-terminal cleavage/methylation domain-containing protein [Candidatus Nitricoxidireducens bremensis]